MGRVQDKVAIVTGGASGLGAEDARLLAGEGARVVIADVDEDAGRALAGEIGDAAVFMRLDVTSEADWQAVVDQTQERFGGLDILVNNAGILLAASVEETEVEVWEKIMRVNALGIFLGCKHALGAMRERGGAIVNMGSLAAVAGMSTFCAYSASKGAVTALTRNVAAYCRRENLKVRCNVIHPDGIKTPMLVGLYENPQPGGLPPQPANPNQAAARLADARDIANLVLFLASDEAKFINGSEYRIDNGWTIWADR